MAGKRHGDPRRQRWGRQLARLAADQHGVVSRAQLRRLGFSTYEIERDIGAGRLHRVFRGVYSVGTPPAGDRQRMRAATLACGERAVVSHRSAASLFGLVDRAPAVVDVIARGDAGRKVDGIRAHDVKAPAPSEIGRYDGIPCVSPARALVDIAGEVTDRTLRGAFERAAAGRMLDLVAVEAAASRPVRGAPRARLLCAEWSRAAPLARRQRLRSPLEAMILPLLLQRGAPPPRANAPVRLRDGGTIEVDFLWDEQHLVVEADSRDFHATDIAFERDRWRDRELLRVGFWTLRITRLQAEREAGAVAEAIAERLASAQSGGTPQHPPPSQ